MGSYLFLSVALIGVLVGAGAVEPSQAAALPLRLLLSVDGIAKGLALGAALSIVFLFARNREGAPAPRGAAIRGGVLAALAFLPVMLGISWVQQRAYEATDLTFRGQDLVLKAVAGDDASFLLVAFFAVVTAPLFEEVLFRGFLHGGLRRWMGPVPASAITAALFAAHHLEVDVLPALFAMGLVLSWLRERTGGLLAPLAMHACYNAVQVVGMWTARGG
jgi:membrane protease YdiL (CAAX protease family)